VSSLSSAPSSIESPSANAAHTNARFVMLFDPGGRTIALSRASVGSGTIAIVDGVGDAAEDDMFDELDEGDDDGIVRRRGRPPSIMTMVGRRRSVRVG
jgi:hypothetical protein